MVLRLKLFGLSQLGNTTIFPSVFGKVYPNGLCPPTGDINDVNFWTEENQKKWTFCPPNPWIKGAFIAIGDWGNNRGGSGFDTQCPQQGVADWANLGSLHVVDMNLCGFVAFAILQDILAFATFLFSFFLRLGIF